jgi:hypothetical protein
MGKKRTTVGRARSIKEMGVDMIRCRDTVRGLRGHRPMTPVGWMKYADDDTMGHAVWHMPKSCFCNKKNYMRAKKSVVGGCRHKRVANYRRVFRR